MQSCGIAMKGIRCDGSPVEIVYPTNAQSYSIWVKQKVKKFKRWEESSKNGGGKSF